MLLLGAWAFLVQLLAVRAFVHGVLSPSAPPVTRIAPHRVAINEAGIDELQVLPGVGPRLAEAIVLERIRGGRFRNLVDLERVPGLGGVRAQAFGPFVRF